MGREAGGSGRAGARQARVWLLLISLAASACDRPPPPEPGAPSTASADEVAFVVFSEPRLVIEGVGAAARVPAAVGSTVSGLTITSGDPRVVEVTAEGELRARSAGTATVRATGNPAQVLVVEVRESSAQAGAPDPRLVAPVQGSQPGAPLTLTPGSADLRPGQVIFFEVVAGAARVQPQWSFVGPVVLRQTAPTGFVATTIGKSRLCASSGLQSSCASIVVSR